MNFNNLRHSALFAESWNVAFRKMPTGSILSDRDAPFHVIPNPLRYWAADPFIIERNGDTFIFAELYDYFLRRGILGCCQIINNRPTAWIPVIQEPFHLSYPCVAEADGAIYLIPESCAAEALIAYKAVEFPYKWEKHAIIRDHVHFADTTPLENGLALTHQVSDPQSPKLTLIDLKRIRSDITISDAIPFQSRPAGQFFEHNGQRTRPAQLSTDSGNGYGKGLIFYHCEIDTDQYSEKEIQRILPSFLSYDRPIYLDGMHTYNSSSHYEVIDIKTRRFNLINFIMRIISKIIDR